MSDDYDNLVEANFIPAEGYKGPLPPSSTERMGLDAPPPKQPIVVQVHDARIVKGPSPVTIRAIERRPNFVPGENYKGALPPGQPDPIVEGKIEVSSSSRGHFIPNEEEPVDEKDKPVYMRGHKCPSCEKQGKMYRTGDTMKCRQCNWESSPGQAHMAQLEESTA